MSGQAGRLWGERNAIKSKNKSKLSSNKQNLATFYKRLTMCLKQRLLTKLLSISRLQKTPICHFELHKIHLLAGNVLSGSLFSLPYIGMFHPLSFSRQTNKKPSYIVLEIKQLKNYLLVSLPTCLISRPTISKCSVLKIRRPNTNGSPEVFFKKFCGSKIARSSVGSESGIMFVFSSCFCYL